MIAFNITSPKRKRALFIHCGGESLNDIFDTLDTGDANNFEMAKDALTAYFSPKRNTTYESIMFRRTKQDANETVSQYCTRLRKLAVHCKFLDVDREILIQMVDKCI